MTTKKAKTSAPQPKPKAARIRVERFTGPASDWGTPLVNLSERTEAGKRKRPLK